MSDLHAAIDIGTNSIHLVVARPDGRGGFEVVTSEKEMVRLGSGGGEMKTLTPEAVDRGLAALDRMVQMARSFEVRDISAVATSAIREARNQDDFIGRARNEIGVDVAVISGFEEARLIHLGVLQALPVFDKRLLLVDIGGGSTELLVGEGDTVLEARSMKLGAIRLTERFFAGREPTTDDVEACRHYVRAALAPVAHELRGHQPQIAVGSSGTIGTVATMTTAARGDAVRQLNGTTFTVAELDALLQLLTESSPSERRSLPGLDEKRADIIVGGVVLLDQVFHVFGLEEMTFSDYALREGVLFDRLASRDSAGLARLADLRRANVMRLVQQLDPDPRHAQHTANLATQLFDRTQALHQLDGSHRELLEAAAMLHNVGLFISHSAHHKHSYYVIRNTEHLTGFDQHEIELIALVARYHRKSLPSDKHSGFDTLSKPDKRVVRVLAGLVRIAIGLDRGHTGTVQSVRVFLDDDHIGIEPVADAGTDLALEIYAAQERTPLLARALDIAVEVRPRPVIPQEHLSS